MTTKERKSKFYETLEQVREINEQLTPLYEKKDKLYNEKKLRTKEGQDLITEIENLRHIKETLKKQLDSLKRNPKAIGSCPVTHTEKQPKKKKKVVNHYELAKQKHGDI